MSEQRQEPKDILMAFYKGRLNFDETLDRLLSESQAEVERLRQERDEWKATAEALEDPLSRETLLESSELAESQARERQLEADYRDLLCAHPERQHEALQAYLSSSVGGERTIDAAREVLSSETERKR